MLCPECRIKFVMTTRDHNFQIHSVTLDHSMEITSTTTPPRCVYLTWWLKLCTRGCCRRAAISIFSSSMIIDRLRSELLSVSPARPHATRCCERTHWISDIHVKTTLRTPSLFWRILKNRRFSLSKTCTYKMRQRWSWTFGFKKLHIFALWPKSTVIPNTCIFQ